MLALREAEEQRVVELAVEFAVRRREERELRARVELLELTSAAMVEALPPPEPVVFDYAR